MLRNYLSKLKGKLLRNFWRGILRNSRQNLRWHSGKLLGRFSGGNFQMSHWRNFRWNSWGDFRIPWRDFWRIQGRNCYKFKEKFRKEIFCGNPRSHFKGNPRGSFFAWTSGEATFRRVLKKYSVELLEWICREFLEKKNKDNFLDEFLEDFSQNFERILAVILEEFSEGGILRRN